jgi:hypothetical protein
MKPSREMVKCAVIRGMHDRLPVGGGIIGS